MSTVLDQDPWQVIQWASGLLFSAGVIGALVTWKVHRDKLPIDRATAEAVVAEKNVAMAALNAKTALDNSLRAEQQAGKAEERADRLEDRVTTLETSLTESEENRVALTEAFLATYRWYHQTVVDRWNAVRQGAQAPEWPDDGIIRVPTDPQGA